MPSLQGSAGVCEHSARGGSSPPHAERLGGSAPHASSASPPSCLPAEYLGLLDRPSQEALSLVASVSAAVGQGQAPEPLLTAVDARLLLPSLQRELAVVLWLEAISPPAPWCHPVACAGIRKLDRRLGTLDMADGRQRRSRQLHGAPDTCAMCCCSLLQRCGSATSCSSLALRMSCTPSGRRPAGAGEWLHAHPATRSLHDLSAG